MTNHTHTLPRKGFTLIELLTVIAIIGILAAIIIPTVGNVRTKAAQTKSSSNMRQIAMGYNNYANSGSRTRTIGDGAFTTASNRQAQSAVQWAEVLSYHTGLHDASLWYIDVDDDFSDYAASENPPKTVGSGTGSSWAVNTDFDGLDDSVLGYVVVVGMSANAPTSTTPLLWTQGLETTDSGMAWSNSSAWKGEGGHIAFMDGHVAWYADISEDNDTELVAGSNATDPGSATSSIDDAINTKDDVSYYPASSSSD